MSDQRAAEGVNCPSFSAIALLEDGDLIAESEFRQSVNILKEDKYSYAGLCPDKSSINVAFVKCYFPKGAIGRLVSRLGWSRADRVFRRARAIDACLPVVRPQRIVHNRISWRTYVFFPFVSGKNLSEIFKQDSVDDTQMGRLMAMVGSALATFHQAGWSHGDFKWGNVILSPSAQGFDDAEVCFVDLDGSRRTRSSKPAARDLARFIVNAEDYRLNEAMVRKFVDSYAAELNESTHSVLLRCGGPLKKLRRRHDRKYGLRNASMFERETG